jgi:hypothetical protein
VRIRLVLAAVLCVVPSLLPLSAEPIGLTVGDLAEPGTQGAPGVACGIAAALRGTDGSGLSSDATTIGVRGSYSILDALRVFADLTLLNNDELGTDLGLQLGAISPIPVEQFDLALRATVYGSDGDERDVCGGTGMVLWSLRTPLEAVALYTGTGLDYKYEERPAGEETTKHSELNPVVDFGVMVLLTDYVSVFAEVMYDDQWSASGGLRLTR